MVFVPFSPVTFKAVTAFLLSTSITGSPSMDVKPLVEAVNQQPDKPDTLIGLRGLGRGGDPSGVTAKSSKGAGKASQRELVDRTRYTPEEPHSSQSGAPSRRSTQELTTPLPVAGEEQPSESVGRHSGKPVGSQGNYKPQTHRDSVAQPSSRGGGQSAFHEGSHGVSGGGGHSGGSSRAAEGSDELQKLTDFKNNVSQGHAPYADGQHPNYDPLSKGTEGGEHQNATIALERMKGQLSNLQSSLQREGQSKVQELERVSRELDEAQRGRVEKEEEAERIREELRRLGTSSERERERKEQELHQATHEVDLLRKTIERQEQEIWHLKEELFILRNRSGEKELLAAEQEIKRLEEINRKHEMGQMIPELQARIFELEDQVGKLLGLSSVKVEGQTIVWQSPAKASFHHSRRKEIKKVDESEIKEAIARIVHKYKSELAADFKGKIQAKGLREAMDELNENDPDSFDVIRGRLNSLFSKPKGLEKVMELFKAEDTIFQKYKHEKSMAAKPGQEDYVALQDSIARVRMDVDQKKFSMLMNEFWDMKEEFVKRMIKQSTIIDNELVLKGYIRAIDLIELDMAMTPIYEFGSALYVKPEGVTMATMDEPFNILNRQALGASKLLDEMKFRTRVVSQKKSGSSEREEVTIAGFDQKDLFHNYRKVADKQVYKMDRAIEIVENMYMLEIFQARWQYLQKHVFNESLLKAIRDLNQVSKVTGKPLLDSDVKGLLTRMVSNPDFMDQSEIQLSLDSNLLTERLKPALSIANEKEWEESSYPNFRKTTQEIYRTFDSQVRLTKRLHSWNPLIKEFQE